MMSEEECFYLHWVGAQWRRHGHICEVGSWLGGSTVCLLDGMRQARPVSDEFCLHVYDNFVWRDSMALRAPLDLRDGQSFRPAFERNIRDYADLVVVHEESLPDEVVPGDHLLDSTGDFGPSNVFSWEAGPLEILFVDGAKSWSGMRHLLSEVAPSLVADSLLILQDYKYWGTYWVAMSLEMISGVELVHILHHNTVTFRVREPLSVDFPDFRDVSVAEGLEALDRASARLHEHGDEYGAIVVQTGKIRFLGNKGELERAEHVLRGLERRWPTRVRELNLIRAREWLSTSLGRKHRRSLVFRLRRAPRKVKRLVMNLRPVQTSTTVLPKA